MVSIPKSNLAKEHSGNCTAAPEWSSKIKQVKVLISHYVRRNITKTRDNQYEEEKKGFDNNYFGM